MRVLLVHPYKDDAYHKVGFVVPPMGLAYVASALSDAGHEVEIRDLSVDRRAVDFSRYGTVGIYMDTSRFKSGLAVAAEAAKAGCKVVAGGPHVSFRDGEALSSGLVDFVVRGEGERTAAELVSAMDEGRGAEGIPGVSFMSGAEVVRNPDRGFIEDLDSLRPSRRLLDMSLYRRLEMGGRKITPVVTSRGCPYACSFCASSELGGRKWRAMSPGRVVDEIEEVVSSFDYGGIAFLDDNFSMDPRRVIAICDEILARGLDVYWWCFSRADVLARNEDMVRKMAEAGCRYVFIGLESGRQETLDRYGKGIKSAAAAGVVRMLESHGISTHASFIIGDVHETRQMVLDTIRLAKAVNPMAVQFSVLTPYPGTRLFDELEDRISTFDWDLYDCLNPVVRCDHLGPEELRGLLRKAYASFYLSPRKIASAVFSGLRGRGVRLGSILKILRGTA